VIGALAAPDRETARRHLPALGRADRYQWFLWAADDGAIAAYVDRTDFVRAVLIGATEGGTLVGLG